ncbi:MAG: hypothetical protein PUK70_01745 [Bacteroidales bacterium]|nr:hypothetical protein [Bacteroidales bacterium]MDY6002642.1 hypothetical protein [Candidatus Cryptobacteroides sp.]
MSDVKLKVTTKMLADYMRHLFPADDGGCLQVSSTLSLGRLIIAHAATSPVPVPMPDNDLVLPLRLPLNAATMVLKAKFLYFPAWSEAALNMAIAATFDLDFTGYYRAGESLKMDKKDIVEAFIFSRGLVSSDYFDALHKRAYRSELRMLEAMRDKLLRKVYYINESIDKSNLNKI